MDFGAYDTGRTSHQTDALAKELAFGSVSDIRLPSNIALVRLLSTLFLRIEPRAYHDPLRDFDFVAH